MSARSGSKRAPRCSRAGSDREESVLGRYDSAFRFLFALERYGVKAGLENIRVLLAHLGNPERSYPAIHVAGTNGKGSTSAMIAASLTAAGFRTGLYTSPHLVEFTERIRIDGRKIPPRRLAEYTRILRPRIADTRATYFEAATAIAFRYFADEGVDIAVIETGLGGRWDSTNVITPLVSVITSIGLEHQEYLGNTVRSIAREKAGIIKPGVPCVVGAIASPAIDVILARSARLGSRVIRGCRSSAIRNARFTSAGVTADFTAGGRTIRRLHVGAAGAFQALNASVALHALNWTGAVSGGFAVGESAVRRGFSSLNDLTGFSGRLQRIGRDPAIFADVAHNPDGIGALDGLTRGAPQREIQGRLRRRAGQDIRPDDRSPEAPGEDVLLRPREDTQVEGPASIIGILPCPTVPRPRRRYGRGRITDGGRR